MSAVGWHRKEGDAWLRGSERAHAQVLCRNVALGVLHMADPTDLEGYLDPGFAAELNERADRQNEFGWVPRWWQSFDLAFGGTFADDRPLITPKGRIGAGEVCLNTAITLGNAPMRVLAWMQGTCESHGRWEEEQIPALIEAIEEGLELAIMRKHEGWDRVLGLLREGSGPVVWSYTICDSFPNPDVAGIAESVYARLSAGTQWDTSVQALRKAKWPPAFDVTVPQGYQTGESALDLLAYVWERRMAEREQRDTKEDAERFRPARS